MKLLKQALCLSETHNSTNSFLTIAAINADVSITISMFTSGICIIDKCTTAILFVKCQEVERQC